MGERTQTELAKDKISAPEEEEESPESSATSIQASRRSPGVLAALARVGELQELCALGALLATGVGVLMMSAGVVLYVFGAWPLLISGSLVFSAGLISLTLLAVNKAPGDSAETAETELEPIDPKLLETRD